MPDELNMLARIEALEARLGQVEGVQDITNLKSKYGALADARYTRTGPKPQAEIDEIANRLANLFTHDAIWDGGVRLGECVGRDAIRERFRQPSLSYSWHFFVKPEIQVNLVNRDKASGTWDVFALVTTREGRAMWMVGVEYDEYERRDGSWLHSRMRLDSRLIAPYDRGWSRPD